MTPRIVPGLTVFAVMALACVTRSPDRAPITKEPIKTQASELPRIAAPTRADDKPVIVSLKLRDQTLRVTSTGAGPRFLVERSDGVVVGRELGDDELKAQHRELWNLYRSGYASGQPYLDATRTRQKPFVDSRLDP